MSIAVRKPDFNSEPFPFNCERCERLGCLFVDDLEQPLYILCKKCGAENSNVWCPKCGMGGSYVREIRRHPATWSCPGCHSKFTLPHFFYDDAWPLEPIEDLPSSAQARIRRMNAASSFKISPIGLLLFVPLFIVVLAILFWPFALGYWLIYETRNPIWLPLGFLTVFPWFYFGKSVINPLLAGMFRLWRKLA